MTAPEVSLSPEGLRLRLPGLVRKLKPCRVCGGLVAKPGPIVYCEEHGDVAKRERWRRRNAARRTVPKSRRLTVQQLGHRDGWCCHLCRRRVNRRLKHPHPMSPSRDHLIPLSDSGTEAPENLALAHLECNVLRQAGGVVQLLLIG